MPLRSPAERTCSMTIKLVNVYFLREVSHAATVTGWVKEAEYDPTTGIVSFLVAGVPKVAPWSQVRQADPYVEPPAPVPPKTPVRRKIG